MEFTGLLFNAQDSNTYLAKMELGRRGEWLFQLSYTSESGGNGAFTFTFYLLLGKVAGLLNLPSIIIFHLARLVGGLALLAASYWFICRLFSEKTQRRFAFVLVCFSAGLGWMAFIFIKNPADFWVAEGYTFLSIFANPHFPLATALLILVIGLSAQCLEQYNKRYIILSAFLAFVLGFVHPFLLFTVGGVLGVFWLRLALEKRKPDWAGLVGLIGIGLTGIPGPFLTWIGTQNDPLLREWMSQNQTPTLDPVVMLAGYGLLIPAGLAGIWVVYTRIPANGWKLVTGWFFITLVLLLLPFSFSRRFLEGLHLPLCCLAAVGWYGLVANRIEVRKQMWSAGTFIAIASFSSLGMVVLASALLYLPNDDLFDPVRSPYLSAGEVGAIDWLRHNSPENAVVLSGPVIGNILPGRTPVRTFYGHSMETLQPEKKLEIMKQFFDLNTSNTVRLRIINEWHLNYLFYGWREQQLGFFNPSTEGWPILYEKDNVRIYALS
jgi:hypothetical protein